MCFVGAYKATRKEVGLLQMTNTELLKDAIKQSGLKMCYLAGRLNVSYPIFASLVNGKRELTEGQIDILCDELKIKDPARKTAIFFAPRGA
jgi:hypothetical protein